MDGLSYFLTSEQNMFDPVKLLRDLQLAIETGESKEKFTRTFNIYEVSIEDGQVCISSYLSDSDRKGLYNFSEFETRVLDFYNKFPYE